jgi:opacity protein-like surface antigen
MGSRFTIPTLALLAALMAIPAARAADMPLPPPAAEPCCSNWYLRGFVGVGMNGAYNLDVTNVPAGNYFASNSIGDSTFIGGGVGYNWNSWLRFDATAEYRSKARITALSVFTPPNAAVALDQFEGNLKSWVFLANAYVDLGTWNCFTPFVGAGIGGAYNMISDFTDVTPDVAAFGNATGSSFGLGRGTNNWDLAWALYAGLTYNVSNAFKVDLTYRYLNYGSAKETVDCNGGTGCNAFTFKDLHSNDIMLGLRWTCCDTPPAYMPPPLHSKG